MAAAADQVSRDLSRLYSEVVWNMETWGPLVARDVGLMARAARTACQGGHR
jgi:hypothetical protein